MPRKTPQRVPVTEGKSKGQSKAMPDIPPRRRPPDVRFSEGVEGRITRVLNEAYAVCQTLDRQADITLTLTVSPAGWVRFVSARIAVDA